MSNHGNDGLHFNLTLHITSLILKVLALQSARSSIYLFIYYNCKLEFIELIIIIIIELWEKYLMHLFIYLK